MRRTTFKRIAVFALVLVWLAGEAAALGPKAQRAVSVTALQLVRRSFPEAFRAETVDYEEDLVHGAIAGPAQIMRVEDISGYDGAATRIANEIQLLRKARTYGTGSYYAYRMGVLSALVTDAIMPFSFDYSAKTVALRKKMEVDFESLAQKSAYKPQSEQIQFIRDVSDYLTHKRELFTDAVTMLEADYGENRDASSYLANAGEPMITHGILAIANVWYTVLRPEKDTSDVAPSQEALTWYFVAEIDYLLQVKRNVAEADRAYGNFASVNPGIMAAYERVGDSYCAAGFVSRGVKEWQQALNFQGSERARLAKKLADHYLDEGRTFLANAATPKAQERDLENALDNFQNALSYDRTSEEAADMISKTRTAIKEREERRELAIRMVASAEMVLREAETSEIAKAYADAIQKYNKANTLFTAVSSEFSAQAEAAKQGGQNTKKRVAKIINDLIDQAQGTVEEGDRLVEQNQYDQAMEKYKTVPSILSPIPDDPSTSWGKEKKEWEQKASAQLDQAQIEKQRWEEEQKRREEAAKKAAEAAGRANAQ